MVAVLWTNKFIKYLTERRGFLKIFETIKFINLNDDFYGIKEHIAKLILIVATLGIIITNLGITYINHIEYAWYFI